MTNFKGNALTETTLYILSALTKPLHGYGIIKVVKRGQTAEWFWVPVLYMEHLRHCKKTGRLKRSVVLKEDATKKTYQITKIGIDLLKTELERIEELAGNISLSLKESNREQ